MILAEEGKEEMFINKNACACLTTAIMLLLMFTVLIPGDSTVSSTLSSASRSTGGVTFYPWPMFHHDLNNTGYTESPAPRTNTLIWNATVGSVPCGGATIANGIVYTAGSTSNPDIHYVHALDMITGEKLWNYTVSQIVRSALAVADGIVYFGSENTIFYALDAATGAEKWTYTTGDVIARSHPAVADGIVYFGSYDRNVYALDAATGALVWKYDTGDKVRGCPAVVDGTVYIGSASDIMYALDATTGTFKWAFTTSPAGDIRGSPAVVDGKVFFGHQDGMVYCLDASTGQKLWNYTTGFPIFSSPAVAYGLVFIGSNDYNVYALNMTTGEKVWSYAMASRAEYASPVVAEGLLFIGDYGEGTLYCLNATTGREVWTISMGGSIRGPTPVADGLLFVGTFKVDVGGELCAFGTLPQAPVASFTFSPASPDPGENITFDASASTDPDGSIVSYTWDFGDATPTVTETNPVTSHNFSLGAYWVTLTVTDNMGLTRSITKQVPVGVAVYSLTVEVLWSNGSAIEGANVTVGGSAGSTNASGLWSLDLAESSYNLTVEYAGVTLLNTSMYLNKDTTVTCTVNSEPFERIADLEKDLEAARKKATNNLYMGIGIGVAIGIVIGLAVMFARKKS